MSIGTRRLSRSRATPDPMVGGIAVTSQASTLYAAGFHNALHIANSAVHGDVSLAGGDVHGVNRSTNNGAIWGMVNGTIPNNKQKYVSAVTSHPSVPGVFYVASGSATMTIQKSVNYGATWAARNATAFGGGTEDSSTQPRRVQNLLAVDPTTSGTNTILYAGCGNGLYRSQNDGQNWSRVPTATGGALEGGFVTCIVLDPQDPSVLYAGVDKVTAGSDTSRGFYRVSGLKSIGNATVTEIRTTGEPLLSVQDLSAVVNGSTTEIWIAAGRRESSDPGGTTDAQFGVFRYIVGSPSVIHNVTPSALDVGSTGYSVCGISVVKNASNLAVLCSTKTIAANGDATWRHLSGQNLVSANRGGWINANNIDTFSKRMVTSAGEEYWLYKNGASFMPTGSAWVGSAVQINPTQPNIAMMTGRSAIVRTTNFLSASATWYMASVGYGSTGVYGLGYLPSNPSRMIFNTVDWEIGTSLDGFVSAQPQGKHISGLGQPAWSANIDALGKVYIGTSMENYGDGKANGTVTEVADAFAATLDTTNLLIAQDVVAQGKWTNANQMGSPRAILACYNGATRKLNIFANGHGAYTGISPAVGGVIHKSGNSTARLVLDLGQNCGGAFRSSFAHQTNTAGAPTGVIFFYTHTHGIYRSLDWGATWVSFWSFNHDSNDNSLENTFRVCGDLLCIPGKTSLYFTALLPDGTTRLYRIAGANTAGASISTGASPAYSPVATNCSVLRLANSSISMPGRLAYDVDHDRIFVAQPLEGTGGGMLYYSSVIDDESTTPTFTDCTTTGWHDNAMFPLGLTYVPGTNRLYCNTDGMGIYFATISAS